ncbi:MAG: glycosyltransferase family 4 protein [Actinomycetota bacterium]|nr:glycosyltransferase family 4 protein [Actinomycetota bacterium]
MLPTGQPRALEDGPRFDVEEIAARLDADVVYPPSGSGPFSALERRSRQLGHWGQAILALRTRPELILSLAEKVGLAVEMLNRRPQRPHVVVAHHLTSPRRQAFQRCTGWLNRLERVIVVSRVQARYLVEVAGLSAQRVRFVYDKVDHRFFSPQGGADDGYVVSVGRSRRDYPTLIEALRLLDVPAVIVPSSPWLHDAQLDLRLPDHVRVEHDLSFLELRRLYDRAALAVVPLHGGTDFAAGVNAILEGMAMRLPLVVSSTSGIADYVEDGVTAALVPPGDVGALREAISRLLSDRQEASRLAGAGRALVDSGRNLDGYVDAVASIAREAAASRAT